MKMYMHRTYAAIVTDVYEVEYDEYENSQEDARHEGKYCGSVVGDTIDWALDCREEILPHSKESIPFNMLPSKDFQQ